MPPPRTQTSQSLQFPRGFKWGVATAATQIEGAAFIDGKGESIWDRFARTPGKIIDKSTPDVACDHYHRYQDDCRLMCQLGVRHYRLSVGWPRIFPQGRGAVNQRGLDFYNRLIDALLAHAITPWVTLFHWDLPQALENEGGWRVRSTPEAFATYADAVVKALGDRVKNWFTVNEISCFTQAAYGGGDKAPGVNEGAAVVNQACHHALLAHGHAVRAVREWGGAHARVGIADNPIIPVPVTETNEDIAAAHRAFTDFNARGLDPVCRGHYAASYLRAAAAARPKVERGDFTLISQPTDFLGLNIYTGTFVRAASQRRFEALPLPKGYPRTDAPWLAQIPQALYWGTRLARDVYGAKDIYITENGAGYHEQLAASGEVIDLHRRGYVRNCLHELHRAIADDVRVRGYFLWSLMDNFEWQDGYTLRFGICHTDYKTLKRTPKLSAYWYAKVIASNRLV